MCSHATESKPRCEGLWIHPSYLRQCQVEGRSGSKRENCGKCITISMSQPHLARLNPKYSMGKPIMNSYHRSVTSPVTTLQVFRRIQDPSLDGEVSFCQSLDFPEIPKESPFSAENSPHVAPARRRQAGFQCRSSLKMVMSSIDSPKKMMVYICLYNQEKTQNWMTHVDTC